MSGKVIDWNGGQWIRRRREHHRWTVAELARRMEVYPRRVRTWEEKGCHTFEEFERLVAVFGLSGQNVPDGTFPARLTYARKRLRIGRDQLAKKARLSPAELGKLERGYASPSEALLSKLAQVCEVPMEWLHRGTPGMRPSPPDKPSRAPAKESPQEQAPAKDSTQKRAPELSQSALPRPVVGQLVRLCRRKGREHQRKASQWRNRARRQARRRSYRGRQDG